MKRITLPWGEAACVTQAFMFRERARTVLVSVIATVCVVWTAHTTFYCFRARWAKKDKSRRDHRGVRAPHRPRSY